MPSKEVSLIQLPTILSLEIAIILVKTMRLQRTGRGTSIISIEVS